ncbi:MAG TPA: VWA domain-containing protein, partial [Erysipelothrix sp.]|nr:VWA domain-containing protein [Erysipelothrix sp.]
MAAQAFIDKLLPNGTTKTRTALVTYSTTTSIANGFVNATERSSLNTKVENLTANGGTNIQAGMRTARVLIQNSNADIKTIILLSEEDPTLSCAINNLDTETDLVTFGHNEQFKETKRGIDLNKYSTNTLAGD